jgi:hypothetical protein
MYNRQGQDIVKEIGVKKIGLPLNHVISGTLPQAYMVKRKETCKNIQTSTSNLFVVYHTLRDIVNFNRMASDIYVQLLNQLDEVLFNECKDIDLFYVKEEAYSLESLYYKQESWISEVEWQELQVFHFLEGESFDIGESTHILMYLGNIKTTYTDLFDAFACKKLRETLSKILHKVELCTSLINNILNALFNLEEDNTFTR